MERFIRYFYEYKQDKRIRNAGFVKVEAGSEETTLHMQGKGFQSKEDRQLEIFLLYEENGNIIRIRQEEICLLSPVFNHHFTYTSGNVEKPEDYEKVLGILIETGEGRKIAATWDDRCVDVSRVVDHEAAGVQTAGDMQSQAVAEDDVWIQAEARDDVQAQTAVGEDMHPQLVGNEFEQSDQSAAKNRDSGMKERETASSWDGEEEIQMSGDSWEEEPKEKKEIRKTLTRITRQDISRLPHCEWKLTNNQFLMHGYRNFHHLLLIDDGIYLKLGVPGIYHIKEAKCARDFGFEEFLSAEELGISDDIKDNQEELFGYWCRPVKRRFRRQE